MRLVPSCVLGAAPRPDKLRAHQHAGAGASVIYFAENLSPCPNLSTQVPHWGGGEAQERHNSVWHFHGAAVVAAVASSVRRKHSHRHVPRTGMLLVEPECSRPSPLPTALASAHYPRLRPLPSPPPQNHPHTPPAHPVRTTRPHTPPAQPAGTHGVTEELKPRRGSHPRA